MPFEAKHIYPKGEANTLSLNDPKSQQKLQLICLKNKIIILTKLLYQRGIQIQYKTSLQKVRQSTIDHHNTRIQQILKCSVPHILKTL